MIPTFEYLQPKSLREACELKKKYGQKAVYWAGGTDLLLGWKRGAVDLEYCIDLSYLDNLCYIRQDDQQLRIGTLTTIASLKKYKEYKNGHSILLTAASQFATPQIRNVATLGGNLCHAVPSADYAPPLIVIDAEVKLLSTAGERTLPLNSFFKGVKRTALENDELLVEIKIPVLPSRSACSYLRKARTSVDIPQVNIAVRLTMDEQERISHARIALGAVAPTPFRSEKAEEMLIGKQMSEIKEELLEEVGERAATDTRPITDIRASAIYRKRVSKVLVKRALVEAIEKLKEVER